MKGVELARRYFHDIVLPSFARQVPELVERMAFGLVGPGSECYGYDDEISRDHDWGPRVCIWIPEQLYLSSGPRLQSIYDELDGSFAGFGPVNRLDTRARRDGIISISQFYVGHLGTDRVPETLREWLVLPEEALSLCTNGEVFRDPSGDFTRIRDGLLAYYPHDLWLKKIASRCKAAAQHGQYNLPRAARRGDRLAQHHHTGQFMTEAARLVYLLGRSYRPFSKWLFAGLSNQGSLGVAVRAELLAIEAATDASQSSPAVERCADILISEIARLGLARKAGDFLYDYGFAIERSIEDRLLREELDSIE